MEFRIANTWPERGAQLDCVKHKCNSVIAKLHLPDTDARVQGMIHVRQLCNTLAAVPMQLQRCAEVDANGPLLMGVLGVQSNADLRGCLEDLNSNAKCGFLTVVQFALENSARQVVHALTGSAPENFRPIAQKLVRECALPDAESKLKSMLLPAYLRNTLHSNGIHTRDDITLVAGGEPYVFTKDKEVECGTWSHLFVAVFHSLCVYEEAYLSPKVVAKRVIPL